MDIIKRRFEEEIKMKNQTNFKHVSGSILFIICVPILQSCVVYRPYPKNSAQLLTVPEIVQMSKDGVSSKDIINEINQSHTAYGLKADQLAKLRDEGVQDSVINYMEQTHFDAIQKDQRMADSNYWWAGNDGYFYGGLGFGWPYGYFGWNMGPAIIYNVSRGFGGGFHGGGGFHYGFRR
jgi:hypothetical protein